MTDTLTEQAFHVLLDDLMFAIEDEVDTLDDDFDFDRTSGQLVVTFPNTSQVIVSRQVVQQQLWVAAKSGGFHLTYEASDWVCQSTSERLWVLLARVFQEQWHADSAAFNHLT